jgi:hypothetical protein
VQTKTKVAIAVLGAAAIAAPGIARAAHAKHHRSHVLQPYSGYDYRGNWQDPGYGAYSWGGHRTCGFKNRGC